MQGDCLSQSSYILASVNYDHHQKMCYCWCVSSHVDHQVHIIGFTFTGSEQMFWKIYVELLSL